MRVHKLNNVEQAMDLLEKHKVYLFFCAMYVSRYDERNKFEVVILREWVCDVYSIGKGRRPSCS